jgi:hypothetical protein
MPQKSKDTTTPQDTSGTWDKTSGSAGQGQPGTGTGEQAGTFGSARSKADKLAEAGKDQLADEGRRLADGLRESADRGDGVQARLLDVMADTLTELSDDLRGRDLRSMLTQLDDMAHRHPGAVVAGAAFLGFAAIRVARASARHPAGSDTRSGNRRSGAWGGQGYGRASGRGYAQEAQPRYGTGTST